MALNTSTIRSNLFAVAPKFNTSDVDELLIIDNLIDATKIEIDSTQWGSKDNYACSLLVAHDLELMGFTPTTSFFTSTSSNDGVAKKKGKNLEIQYNVTRKTISIDGNNPYNATIYGQKYLRLRKSLRFGLPSLA